MKSKCWMFRIANIYGSRNIQIQDPMFLNKSEPKKYGFVLILGLFLGSTCSVLYKSVPYFHMFYHTDCVILSRIVFCLPNKKANNVLYLEKGFFSWF